MVQNNDTDISLKELVLKIHLYLTYLTKRWKVIGICAFLFALLFLVMNIGNPRIYTARLNFMLNVDERAYNTGLAALAGQFGIGLNPGENNLDKILELSRSRKIAELAFFDSVEIQGKTDILANQMIDMLEKYNRWEPDRLLSFDKDTLPLDGFRFDRSETSLFNTKENKTLKKLHEHLVGSKELKAMLGADYNELTGIMSLTLTTPSEELSIKASHKLFNALSQFYILKSTEKQQYEYNILLEKYDSIYSVLGSVQLSLAQFEDRNKDLFRKKDMIQKEKLQLEEQKLQYMISKAEEQLQLAKIALDNKTPYIQVIDNPISPIKPDNRSLFADVLIGFILGASIAAVLYLCRKIYLDIII